MRAGITTAPDFKALTPAGNFYIEATVFGLSDQEKAAGKRRGQAFDRLDALGDPRFMIHLDIDQEGGDPINLGRLTSTTRSWLESLDPAEVLAEYARGGWRSLPTLPVLEKGWRILLQAYPISTGRRGAADRSVGTYTEGGVVSVHAPDIIKRLQSAIRKKALRYGRPRLPHVVAVLEDRDYPATDQTGMVRALYTGMPTSRGERISALFGTESNPKLTRVSAVITASRLVPWTIALYEPVVWLNPYAQHVFQSPFPWPQARYISRERIVEYAPSMASATDLFGLAEPWPPLDDDP